MAEFAATYVPDSTPSVPTTTCDVHHPPPDTPHVDTDHAPFAISDCQPAEAKYESPLYTEINIPLPPLPSPPHSAPLIAPPDYVPTSPIEKSQSQSRHRAHTLHSFSPFHRRRSSSPASSMTMVEEKEEPEPRRHHERPRRIELTMRDASKGRKTRSGTIDAAIVPAVMVLRAELFTPGEGEKGKNMEVGKGGGLDVVR